MKNFIRSTTAKCLLVLGIIISGYGSAMAQSWLNVGTENFTASTAFSISLVTYHDTVYMAYSDSVNGYKATVVMYNGSSWVTVGSPDFTSGAAYSITLLMDSAGTPYMAYQDYANGQKANMVKYDGSNWVQVGNADFSAGRAYYISFALDHSGTPYVAYEDNNYTNRATVMKFNGSNWALVGTEGFSAGSVYSISLAIDHNDSLYVAYEDAVSTNVGQVKHFNGTSWVTYGSTNFSSNGVDFPTILFDSTNTLYVAYTNVNGGYKASVAKYESGSWVPVGDTDFSSDMAEYMDFAFGKNNTPYVAYTGYNYSSADSVLSPTVMKYNGTAWMPVGSGSLPTGSAFTTYSPLYTSFTVSDNGKLYFAFQNSTDSNRIIVKSYMDSVAADTSAFVQNVKVPGLTVSAYPEPATSEITVSYNAPQPANTFLYLINIAGQTVINKDLGITQTGKVTVPVSQLPEGVYILQFTSGNETSRQKIIVSP